ncbi:MAG: TonB-dependent receptor [Melioribacteraceae bacterium]|nr:TonB-dependent receptor [Melioribacteraceae bacterium]MCF8356303.1 TonB-dependent receptor [Melioribacteraceae bacterium]MCF8395741.1 TonB-dependent receptor [Melioribacteraceae bacterium]MCF8421228.1 TonB-dependent receptor [Melioribacteraceae bacterium]
MRIQSKRIFICFIIIMLIIPAVHWAGTVGKIAGTVKDAATGEALPGCNIIIEGTTMGSAADINGEYFILNVPPGTYTVKATIVGYKVVSVTNVRVKVDLTTEINFEMEPSTVEMDEIVVVAERPLIQKDVTSKQSIVSSDEIINMPVEDFQGVLSTKAGFTTDAEGNLHVRGGRTGEIAYIIDGMYVDEPLYGGFQGLVNNDAIEEMIILSGTYNAEYGNAMSSIVNIVTKEGGNKIQGKFEYTTAMLNQSPYRKKNPFTGVEDTYEYTEKSVIDGMDFKPLDLEIPVSGTFNLSLSGPTYIIPDLYFFVSGRYKNEDSYLPHGYNLQRDGFGKLTYYLSPSFKLSLSHQDTENKTQGYNHAWKYLSENQAHTMQKTNRTGLTFTHTISNSLFYTAQFSHFVNDLKTQVGNKLPGEYVRGQTGETVYFYVKGDDSQYADDQSTTYTGKFDLTFQANKSHLFKSGVEFKSHRIKVHEESQPWEGGAQFKDQYTRYPFEFAGYLQDKIEYNYLIVNLGFRLDYADPKAAMWEDIRRFGYFDADNNWIIAEETKVDPKLQLSPRIGLAHPITDVAVLHFSYGHFFQNPNYNSLYYNMHKDLSSSLPLVGNPAVKAQKTVAYETGIKYKLAEDWALDVSAWYKDITDLLSTLHITYLSKGYVVFYNSDYASVKGFDLTLRKRYSDYLSGSIDYTYMIAKGNNSQPLGGYINAFEQEEIPHQEYYLDFDQRHDISVTVNFNVPRDQGPEFFGIKPFSDVYLSILFQASSGLPYTPYVDPTVRIEINSDRKPWTSTLDFRMSKRVWISNFAMALFVEVTNLFDQQNVRYVYSRTGKPFDTGLAGLVGSSPDANYNPNHVGPPRIIKAGIQLIW